MSLRKAKLSEYREIADILCEAFDLEFILWWSDGDGWTDEFKREFNRHRFECKVWANILCGHVYVVGDEISDYEGVSLWFGPNQAVGPIARFYSGMTGVYNATGPNGRRRLYNGLQPRVSAVRKEILGKDNANVWYLGYLATRKRARGKGYARKLVEVGTRRADEQGLRTYLESSSAVNCKMYEKLGFETRGEIELPEKTPPTSFYGMVRGPAGNNSLI